MKIVFFGSSNFALPALEALLKAGKEVSCVVTQPDRSKGRGLRLEPTAVKTLASSRGLKVYQPQQANSPEAVKFLKDLKPDLFIVLSYGQILSGEVLGVPGIFAVNAHASLLPIYRGAAPINRALMRGERTTGVTIIKMEKKMDAGPVILQEAVDIGPLDNAVTLDEKLSRLAAKLVLQALELIENKNYRLVAQDEKKVSFAPKLKKEEGLIDWGLPAQDIHNLIRGTLPWPGAFTYYKDRLLKIYRAKVIQTTDHRPQTTDQIPKITDGQVIKADKGGITVAAGKDNLLIEELQIEGKRRMAAEEFIAGHKIKAGEILTKTRCAKE